MQPRSERQKILWAVFLSLLLHLVVGVSIASFGDKLQPSLPEDEKPVELTIVDVAPIADSTDRAKEHAIYRYDGADRDKGRAKRKNVRIKCEFDRGQ